MKKSHSSQSFQSAITCSSSVFSYWTAWSNLFFTFFFSTMRLSWKRNFLHFRYMTSFAKGLYFWFSLIYLIIRTLAVSLYSAEINDESKRPVECLRAIPRESWCLEVSCLSLVLLCHNLTRYHTPHFKIKRFTEEVNYDVIALSGKKFFFLTRRLVLSVAGTIITYELVLIQFKTNDDISDYNPCHSNVTTLFWGEEKKKFIKKLSS
jgi:hypothetical protein